MENDSFSQIQPEVQAVPLENTVPVTTATIAFVADEPALASVVEDESIISGRVVNGVQNGFGRYTFHSNVIYTGEFKDGTFHGNGTLQFPNGVVVNSTWFNGEATSMEYKGQVEITEETGGLWSPEIDQHDVLANNTLGPRHLGQEWVSDEHLEADASGNALYDLADIESETNCYKDSVSIPEQQQYNKTDFGASFN